MAMTYREMEMFLMRLAWEREMLHLSLEEAEGEVTEDVLTQQDKIDRLVEIFKSEGGADAVGRYTKYSQDKIASRKAEKEYAERHLKIEEDQHAIFLELVNKALEKADVDKIKGHYGYSFTSHTSVTTKVDTKMLKDRFYDKVERVVRASGVIPDDVTFSLSASVSRLPEGAEKPEWYNTTSVGKATFRKPRKAEDKEEFNFTEFEQ